MILSEMLAVDLKINRTIVSGKKQIFAFIAINFKRDHQTDEPFAQHVGHWHTPILCATFPKSLTKDLTPKLRTHCSEVFARARGIEINRALCITGNKSCKKMMKEKHHCCTKFVCFRCLIKGFWSEVF